MAGGPASLDFLVCRKDLRQTRRLAGPDPTDTPLKPGELLLKVHDFALTANNITYGVFGDAMQYWNFFPAPEGWGCIPVWGFAGVIRSRVEGIARGERLFGYLPMATHLRVKPERLTEAGFMDASAHRKPLPPAYQFYRRVQNDPGYDAKYEDQQALLTPLFMTSFLIEDFLADNGMFGAKSVVLASASSKTALGVAFLLKRQKRAEVIGLTSPGNAAFCEKLGCYNRVLPYDKLETLAAATPTVFVDMAGEGKLLARIHHHFRDQLKHSCIVGATHWEQRDTQHQLPGPKPQFFFAPAQIKKRNTDWGPSGVDQRFAAAWKAFLPSTSKWLKVVYARGAAAVEAAYREVLEGKSRPESGHVLSLWE